MKIRLHPIRRNQGNILFLSLILSIIVGISLGSYLLLTAGQEKSVARSQHWNSALDVAEAGIEEGLAQVNNSPNDFSVNGWTVSGANYGPQSRTLANGNYKVLINDGGATPTIYSTGYVSAPITGTLLSRTIRVTTQVLPLFNVALGAVGNINMNGNGMATDSWNSQSTNLSVNGAYSSSKVSTNGDVASENGIVNIGNHTIDGNLYLGPTATYTSGSNQITGDLDEDYNVNFPDVTLPSSLVAPIPATITNGGYNITLNGSYLITAALPITVAAGLSNVLIKVTAQNFNPGTITLGGGMTNPATLTIYDFPLASGGSVTLGGNSAGGAIGATPLNFIFYGSPNLTSITLSGNSSFIGAIYSPEAILTLNGGGGSNNLMGAAIVKSVTMNGHYDFHYDEALGAFGPSKSFIASSWQEL